MSEPIKPIAQIEPDNWEEFLREFSARNNNRRARFEIFRRGRVEEEGREARLEDIRLKPGGKRTAVEIIRIDRSEKKVDKLRDSISNLRGISVQFDTDGSESALEFTDDENTLISLRFESKVDGAS